jgi:hypothetical protein
MTVLQIHEKMAFTVMSVCPCLIGTKSLFESYDLHALSVSESCIRFAADKSSVTLLTDTASFLAKNQLSEEGSAVIVIPALSNHPLPKLSGLRLERQISPVCNSNWWQTDLSGAIPYQSDSL